MKKKMSGKSKALLLISGLAAAVGFGYVWGKKRNDQFEIEEYTVVPDEENEEEPVEE